MDYSQLFKQVGSAAPDQQRGNYVRTGRHVLDLKDYFVKGTQQGKTVIISTWIVAESVGPQPHGVGEEVSVSWDISKPGWEGDTNKSRAQAMIIALHGLAGQPAEIISAKAAETAAPNPTVSPRSPHAGMRVVVNGHHPIPGKRDPSKSFTPLTWEVSPPGTNAPTDVAARRAAIEQRFGAATSPSYAHATQPAPAPQPPPSYPAMAPVVPPAAAPAYPYAPTATAYPPGYPATAPVATPPVAPPAMQPPPGWPPGYPYPPPAQPVAAAPAPAQPSVLPPGFPGVPR